MILPVSPQEAAKMTVEELAVAYEVIGFTPTDALSYAKVVKGGVSVGA